MQGKRLATVIVTVLIVALLAVALFPVYKDHAKLGLDLQGGVMVRLQAPEGTGEEEMNGAVKVIENRINALGVSEPEAHEMIHNTDKYRAEYYRYYTRGNYWTNPVNYDLTLNNGRLGDDRSIEIIKSALRVKCPWAFAGGLKG